MIHAGFMTDLVEHLGVDRRRIREIRNWTHVDPPDPSASAAFRNAHGWGADEVVVLHAGNMGYKQGLENVIAAAELAARSGSRTRFVLLGDGNQRVSLEAAGAGVRTLEFLPPVSEEEFPAALGAADVLLVNERPGVAQMAVPSKLTSYFRLRQADPCRHRRCRIHRGGARRLGCWRMCASRPAGPVVERGAPAGHRSRLGRAAR